MVTAIKLAFVSALAALSTVAAYEVAFEDTDWSRQICSGMWSDQNTYINVTFNPSSQGQVAMVIYEWGDVQYLGKDPNPDNDYLPKTYVCTARAVTDGLCTMDQLGSFILDLPSGKSVNETSFWSAQLQLPSQTGGQRDEKPTPTQGGVPGFWNNPAGNPTPPLSNYTSPWRRRSISLSRRTIPETSLDARQSGTNVHVYKEPIQYPVRKTGYYCVAIVPVTSIKGTRADTDVPYHPTYEGTVFFRNKFDGKLPASDYPKVNFYSIMSLVYVAFAALWGWRCYQYIHELLPIQHYLSSLVFLLVIEMVANWAYYRYLNSHGKGTVSTVFLIIVAIIDAGRNSLSFLLLLVVALGLSVVRESLGRTMLKCQILAGAHFIFGILYAVGIVELSLESTSALILLLFVIPLAFTLSGFLLWIMYALNATIVQLRTRKQRYKLRMFEKLYYILLATVLVIAAFFVVSSFSFSGRLAEDYAAKSWKSRWWLLDGWLALLYLATFGSIAYLWRPSAHNQRLAMSDEIAQDEEDAEDYDLEAIHSRTRGQDDDDDATLVGGRPGGGHDPIPPGQDVVFEIGDEDDDDEDKKERRRRLSGEQAHGAEHEREGLMGADQSRSRND